MERHVTRDLWHHVPGTVNLAVGKAPFCMQHAAPAAPSEPDTGEPLEKTPQENAELDAKLRMCWAEEIY